MVLECFREVDYNCQGCSTKERVGFRKLVTEMQSREKETCLATQRKKQFLGEAMRNHFAEKPGVRQNFYKNTLDKI